MIALDASNFMLERRTGIKRYLAGLLPALARAAPDLRFRAWMGYLRPVHDDGLPAWTEPNLENRAIRVPRRLIEGAWARGLLPAEWVAGGAAVFHAFWNHLPPSRRCRRVLTVFDFRELVLPELYPGQGKRVRALLGESLRRADVVVASSRATASDLREHFALDGRPIEVVPGAVDASFRRAGPGEVEEVRKRLAIEGPYLIAMGSGDPRKNIPWLIGAFLEYLGRTRDDLRLLITGAPHSSYGPALETAARTASGRVGYLGEIDDADWRALLSGAEALVYPSLYEGFGLPPLEAMACGTPVLASESPAVREWAGEAALYFDPRDREAFGAVVEELRASSVEGKRLVREGLAVSARLGWSEVARAYIGIYRRLLV